MAQESKSRNLDQYIVRLPDGMRDHIKSAAQAAGRSMNAEIVHQLTVAAQRQRTVEERLIDIMCGEGGLQVRTERGERAILVAAHVRVFLDNLRAANLKIVEAE